MARYTITNISSSLFSVPAPVGRTLRPGETIADLPKNDFAAGDTSQGCRAS